MRQPENKDVYIDKITDSVVKHTHADRTAARQGVLQNYDKHVVRFAKGMAWCAYSLAQGAFVRDGGNSIIVKDAILNLIADDCVAIDKELLR